MPTLLLSFKRNSDSHLLVHGFLTPNPKTAEGDLKAHAAACPKFGPAVKNGETIDIEIEVDSIPEFDEEAIGAWVDELLCLDDEDDEEEEDDEAIEVPSVEVEEEDDK